MVCYVPLQMEKIRHRYQLWLGKLASVPIVTDSLLLTIISSYIDLSDNHSPFSSGFSSFSKNAKIDVGMIILKMNPAQIDNEPSPRQTRCSW